MARSSDQPESCKQESEEVAMLQLGNRAGLTPEIEPLNEKLTLLQDLEVHLGEPGSRECSTSSVSEDDCLAAAQALLPEGGINRLRTVRQSSKPSGCSVRNNFAFFNTKRNGRGNSQHTPVCLGPEEEEDDECIETNRHAFWNVGWFVGRGGYPSCQSAEDNCGRCGARANEMYMIGGRRKYRWHWSVCQDGECCTVGGHCVPCTDSIEDGASEHQVAASNGARLPAYCGEA